MIVYRQDRRTGQWNVFGPASEVHVGIVTVTRKDGKKRRESVERVSKPFDVDGVAHVYGYLEDKVYGYSEDKAPKTCANCGERIRGKAHLVLAYNGDRDYCCARCAGSPILSFD